MIIELNTKSNFEDIALDKTNGVYRKYIINELSKNKLDKIVLTSHLFQSKQNKNPFIEVKYDFGRRNKRLEIVYKENLSITICKITNMSEFDKDCLELIAVIEDMKNKQVMMNFRINGTLIFMDNYNREIVETYLNNQNTHFNHVLISEI
ncbi:hypothetical protein IVB69_09290 [Flavobacterium sp. J49]|uniref:hypothetical protein n=1 Tax=Flavobacterium sp. J49 TaxID=2718534 RepID=UPI001594BCE3|nr:hypothetical protein [Flavobacterium sp. J49]MBF6641673.1 hypothetical protein [Flavobacterium sp. J49]NIC02920.1 hypothetical protein [Flavobacterium sp. J49]